MSDEVTRRGFLAGMLAVIALPKVLEDLDFEAWEQAPGSVPDGLHTVAGGRTIGLFSRDELVFEPKPIAFLPASYGMTVSESSVQWAVDRSVLVTGIGLYDDAGELLFRGPTTHQYSVMLGDTIQFPAGSIALTFD